MKYLHFTKAFAFLAVVSALFTACDKKDKIDPIGDRGQTIVKVIAGGTPGMKALAIDFVNTPTRIVTADIRRDVPNNAELMKPMTVTVKDDSAMVTAAGYDHLDPSWYTLVTGNGVTKVGGQGGTYTVTFAPGEFAKPIEIIIPDATVLDPSLNYGLGFKILSSDLGKVTTNDALVVTIGAKNKYDGVYLLKGHHNRVPNNFPYEEEVHMVTTGASSVRMYWPAAGAFGHPIGVAAGTSWYGAAISPEFTFNPSTDLLSEVHNAGGPTPIVMAVPPAAPVSYYDEATKSMYLYVYSFTGARKDFSKRGWNNNLTYIGQRYSPGYFKKKSCF